MSEAKTPERWIILLAKKELKSLASVYSWVRTVKLGDSCHHWTEIDESIFKAAVEKLQGI